MEQLSNSSLTSLPALNVFGARDRSQGLVRGWTVEECWWPLLQLLAVPTATSFRASPEQHACSRFSQVVFVQKLSLEIAELP